MRALLEQLKVAQAATLCSPSAQEGEGGGEFLRLWPHLHATDGFFAAAKAPNPEAAKAFLAFIGSKEAQEYVAKELKRVPVHAGVDPSIFPPETLKGIELLQGADYVAQFYDRDTTPEMAEKGMAAFQQFWSNPGDIDNILAQLEKDRELIFSEEQE